MGFSAPLLIFLLILTFASLSTIECDDSKFNPPHTWQPSLQKFDTSGSLYWKVIRSRLRGETQEEEKDLLEALHQLEREVQDIPNLEDSSSWGDVWDKKSGLERREEEEKDKEEEEERHPADELLQRLHADATISYILGGY